MTIARREIVDDSDSGVYHCISRCVRRSFLCGFDRITGKDFGHRKLWIKNRLQVMSASFGIKVFGYAVMSNHLHVVVQTLVEEAGSWTVEEVARRWLKIFPRRRDEQGNACEPSSSEIGELTRDRERVEVLRGRLCSVSWFMRCLNEHIARRANREDGCKGRFWEGRFKCQRLLDEGAVLACMAYVDLNPIRAGAAKSLEESRYTSVHDRIKARQAKSRAEHLQQREDAGISSSKHSAELCRLKDERKAADWLAELCDPVVGMTADEYLQVIDWTGRQLAAGKRGRIPATVQPILTRLRLDHEYWLRTVESYGSLFWRVAGRTESIAEAATRAGRRWLKGLRCSRRVFAGST